MILKACHHGIKQTLVICFATSRVQAGAKVSLWTHESCASVHTHGNPLERMYVLIIIKHPVIENNDKKDALEMVAISYQGMKHVAYYS